MMERRWIVETTSGQQEVVADRVVQHTQMLEFVRPLPDRVYDFRNGEYEVVKAFSYQNLISYQRVE